MMTTKHLSTPAMRPTNNRFVERFLLQRGFSASIASTVSKNELCFWTKEELEDLFAKLDISSDDMRNPLSSFIIRNEDGAKEMIKPEANAVEESARSPGALCVNRSGQFSLNPVEGYAALSHVWSQGLGSWGNNQGIDKSLLGQVFDLIEPSGIKWIWVDSLAIPGGNKILSQEEEEIKTKLINAMSDIYRLAQKVVIIDALALRLNSVEPVDVGAILSLGSWITRVWTYQEIKLATSAVIATKAGLVDFQQIITVLGVFAFSEVGQKFKITNIGKYPSLYKTLLRLQRKDSVGVSLPDIAFACGNRDASDRIDYARAIFPTLRIPWHMGDTIDDAMQRIYEARKLDATRLALLHGPPRAVYPGWAPATFPGLIDCKIIRPGVWEQRGMARKWHTIKIKRIAARRQTELLLEFENGQTSVSRGVGFLSEETVVKSPESIKRFEIAIKDGTAYLVMDDALTPKQHFSRVGLFVERSKQNIMFEGWVCCTIAMGETESGYTSEDVEWLLYHENPVHMDRMNAREAS